VVVVGVVINCDVAVVRCNSSERDNIEFIPMLAIMGNENTPARDPTSSITVYRAYVSAMTLLCSEGIACAADMVFVFVVAKVFISSREVEYAFTVGFA